MCQCTTRSPVAARAASGTPREYDGKNFAIAGQAPGTRVHRSGVPFTDPSGDRLRDWMGVSPEEFYDRDRIAIIPMGFCFPGLDTNGGDRPPRSECAPLWRTELLAAMPRIDLILAVGLYAHHWHLMDRQQEQQRSRGRLGVTETVRRFATLLGSAQRPRVLPLPHPSWRNNGWLNANPWFETDVLPRLKAEVRQLIALTCDQHPLVDQAAAPAVMGRLTT